MNKKVWGKYFWSTLHITALAYPSKPTIEDRETYKTFFTIFGNILPCKKCTINYNRHLVELPIFPYLESRDELFKWTIMLHNIVNRELGKSQWNIEYALMYYTNLGEYENTCPIVESNKVVSKYPEIISNQSQDSKIMNGNHHLNYIIIAVNIIICFIILHFIIAYR